MLLMYRVEVHENRKVYRDVVFLIQHNHQRVVYYNYERSLFQSMKELNHTCEDHTVHHEKIARNWFDLLPMQHQ